MAGPYDHLPEYVWHCNRECFENIVDAEFHGGTHPYHNVVHGDRLAIFVRARHSAAACLDSHSHGCHEGEHESNLDTRSHWKKQVLEVGGSYDGKFESCGQLIAMDDELRDHILYTISLDGSLQVSFIHLNKSNHVNMPAHLLHAASGFTIMVCRRRR